MDVLTNVWSALLSDTMLWTVGEGESADSTDENKIAEAMRLEDVVVCR